MTNVSDTSLVCEEFLIRGYRHMSPIRKLTLALDMSQMVMDLARIGIKRRHPAISENESNIRLGALIWGRELSIRINHWDPDQEGY